jgi:hypothetical protein
VGLRTGRDEIKTAQRLACRWFCFALIPKTGAANYDAERVRALRMGSFISRTIQGGELSGKVF